MMVLRKILGILLVLMAASPLHAGPHFECDRVVYFSPCTAETKKEKAKDKEENSEKDSDSALEMEKVAIMWGEPYLTPDGRIGYRLPPLPVLRVLNNPSEETVRQYLEWNTKRLEAISRSTELLQRLGSEKNGK